ncbi:I78 family peptidase inhibitor [Streptomyces sp. NBC_00083]|uniref:I78 family peptidase inhibitor n=1 Tax=Streptomyces sp. NBC_00083 TaxID=2975647 RepID=UPI00224FCC76|nr:I78 family peptidase inhibitor [Streptomyces sp. NBC_00083]MCX5383306.1 I78 family peptidase inhibitor [Streptomyces sp. NBC_00083]
MAPIPSHPAHPDDAPESYVGLGSDDAERIAAARGWSTVRSLPPGSIITMEYMAGRLNFEVENGTVTRCWHG